MRKKEQIPDFTSGMDTTVYAARLKRRLRRSSHARAAYLNTALDLMPLADEEPFLAALWGVIRACGGKERVSSMSGISVEALEEAIDGDADLDVIVSVVRFFGLRFHIAPIPSSTAALAADILGSHLDVP